MRKTVSFKEFTMFKDKNTSIFSCQLETINTIIVFFILQTLFVTHGKKMLVNSLHLLFFTVVKNPLIPVSD